jgi:hypothetical protein
METRVSGQREIGVCWRGSHGSLCALAGSEGVSTFGVFRGRPPFAPFAFAAALFAFERWLPMREPTLILCPQWGQFILLPPKLLSDTPSLLFRE